MTTPSAELLKAADLIERFVSGKVEPWEWDDFTSVRHRDAAIEALSGEAISVQARFPPLQSGHWCSEAGRQHLLEIASRARVDATI